MMLDAEEVADYEAWKERKLTGSTDLSVGAYNAEMEGPALAWEAGWRAHELDGSPESYARNPYRAKGMTGERPGKKRLTS
jgi:hypothetical protein